MKLKLLALATTMCLLSAPAMAGVISGQPLNTQVQAFDRFVVQLRPGVKTQTVVDTLNANRVSVLKVIKDAEGDVLAVSIDPRNPPNLAALKGLASSVLSYDLDVGRRPLALTPPILDTVQDGKYVPWGITAVGAREVTYGGGRKVCVIDTGYDLEHPDLPKTAAGMDRGAGAWNLDGHGHGTHVAGTIGGIGISSGPAGAVGVIPDGQADFYIVRAFSAQGALVYATDVAGAMQDCAAAGANVISMSLGGDFSSPYEERVTAKLQRQGILIVAAAGNGSTEPASQGRTVWYNGFGYPASYPSVVSVAAIDNHLQRAPFSQRNTRVALTAPGVGVISLKPGGGWDPMDGTSMATPHVAGVAALVWSNYKQCSNTEIATALKNSAVDLDAAGYDVNTGWGLVSAPGAMAYLASHPCTGRR